MGLEGSNCTFLPADLKLCKIATQNNCVVSECSNCTFLAGIALSTGLKMCMIVTQNNCVVSECSNCVFFAIALSTD